MFNVSSFEKPITKEEYLALSEYFYGGQPEDLKRMLSLIGVNGDNFLDFTRDCLHDENFKKQSKGL